MSINNYHDQILYLEKKKNHIMLNCLVFCMDYNLSI